MKNRTLRFSFVMLAAALLIGFLCKPSHAQEPIFKLYAGANGLWYDAESFASPPDFEVGGNVRASLSPHISGVGSVYYGFDNSYLRGAAGVRFTVTDAENAAFSIGLGIQRHFSSEPDIRPEEWAPDASVGWTPWTTRPRVMLVAQGFYGLSSNEASVLAGVRYALSGGGQ